MDMHCKESDDYAEVLTRAHKLTEQMSEAYRCGDWNASRDLHNAIGTLYAPNHAATAAMISYVVENTFRRAWFDSWHDQDRKRFAS